MGRMAGYAQSLDINGIIQYNNFAHADSRGTRYWVGNDNGKVSLKMVQALLSA